MSRREFLRLGGGLAVALLLPGCRREPPSPLPAPTGLVHTDRYRKTRPWKIGRSGRGDINAWMVMFSAHIEYGVREKYREHFRDYFSTAANWDPNKQIEDIQALLGQGIDLLLIDPLETTVVTNGVEAAMRAGVPVILASTRVRSDQYVSWVTSNEEQRGASCADWLCRQATGGRILVLASQPASGDSEPWLAAVRRRLAAEPGIQDIKVARCSWSSAEARQALLSLMRDPVPISGMVVNNGAMAKGVVEAFVEQGREIPPIAGGDDWNGWLRTAREHQVRFLALTGGANLGLRCVELATQVLSGEVVPQYVKFAYETFESDSLDGYYRPDLSDPYWAVNDLPEAWINRMFKL